ncbi:replicative DNA helicase [Paenibacillus sp. EKM205P]|uniref:replicative DNA helicase n=1 Tax=Paenibacillus sp. EKM205P TaxID=1683673 RepID=UPI0013EC6671|nr:replicative DNA helicase [Paenibacillus sp. EKM205P]KAF6591017.1 replicative DNA helicase [Paenibacillus sp. EKM205P]
MHDIFNVEAEQAVLGSLLLDRTTETADLVMSRLEADHFSPQNRLIFEAAKELHETSRPIDLILLRTVLEERGTLLVSGGIDYLSNLARSVPSLSNIKYYAGLVEERGLKQHVGKMLERQKQAFDEGVDPKELLAGMQEATDEINGRIRSDNQLQRAGDFLDGHDDELERRREAKGLSGVPTAGVDIDNLTGGRQKQDLIIVAARPSVGKTAFMLNGARRAAEAGYAVAIFSLEMPGAKLGERLIGSIGNIDGHMLRTGNLGAADWTSYTMARSILNDLPIYIDDTPGISIQEIAYKVKQFKKKHGEILVQVDYLQLINPGKKFGSRELEISFISRSLKQMARDNDCPVEALAQLSRSVEQRQDKRPMMSDLRESGSIEQDADEIDFLYRDDYYNAETEKKNIVEIIIAKGRNTGTGLAEMVYLKNYSRFCNLERVQY